MSFDLDWTALGLDGNQRQDRLAFNENKHLFRKVAWDAYKPLSGSDILWELREEDGNKFLYAIYENGPELVTTASAPTTSPLWDAISDHEGKNVTLSFMQVPIKRFSAAEYSFAPSEADEFGQFLKAKASEETFISNLLETLPEAKKLAVAKLLNQRGV